MGKLHALLLILLLFSSCAIAKRYEWTDSQHRDRAVLVADSKSCWELAKRLSLYSSAREGMYDDCMMQKGYSYEPIYE